MGQSETCEQQGGWEKRKGSLPKPQRGQAWLWALFQGSSALGSSLPVRNLGTQIEPSVALQQPLASFRKGSIERAGNPCRYSWGQSPRQGLGCWNVCFSPSHQDRVIMSGHPKLKSPRNPAEVGLPPTGVFLTKRSPEGLEFRESSFLNSTCKQEDRDGPTHMSTYDPYLWFEAGCRS